MGLFSSAFYFFTPYTDARERAVGRFFKSLTEHSNQQQIRSNLTQLLQRDIAVVNLWSEYRYKGYKYLNKIERKRLYGNLQLISADFERFYTQNKQAAHVVTTHIQQLAPHAAVQPENVVLLQALNDYFSPHHGVYEYRQSSSFGRLLQDPAHHKLIGDCNQIVTLYMYLYSRHFDVRDLQLRLLPGHVALHYKGIDIETTSGAFANYQQESGSELLPVEEIASINLLDVTDSYLKTNEVAADDLLQASRFAYILSHNRDVVARNLSAAYGRVVNSLMERHEYSQALKIATASKDSKLLGVVGNNGAAYEISRHNFVAARRFAQHAPQKIQLIQSSWQAEGIELYNTHRYHDAIKALEHSGDDTLISRCYEALFFEEQKKLGPSLNTATIKNHSKTINRMHAYAKKSGNRSLLDHANDIMKHL